MSEARATEVKSCHRARCARHLAHVSATLRLAAAVLMMAACGETTVIGDPGTGTPAGTTSTSTSTSTSTTVTTTSSSTGTVTTSKSPDDCIAEQDCENCCVGIFPEQLDVLWDMLAYQCGCTPNAPCAPLCANNICSGGPFSQACWECAFLVNNPNQSQGVHPCGEQTKQLCLAADNCSDMLNCINACD
jgi:hypothetical protein